MYKAADNVALTLDANTGRPLQAQLFEQVRAMIIDGKLGSGAALPATRALSEQLGVSRNTVVLAYDRLLAEGYIESKRSIGTFVSEAIPESGLKLEDQAGLSTESAEADPIESDFSNEKEMMAEIVTLKAPSARMASGAAQATSLRKQPDSFTDDLDADAQTTKSNSPERETNAQAQSQALSHVRSAPMELDFLPGLPDRDAFPLRTWRRIINRQLSNGEHYAGTGADIQGMFELRRAIAEYLGPQRGILTKASEVIIVSNAQEGRSLLCQLLLARTGTAGVMEQPGPSGIYELYRHFGAEIHGVEVDEEGIITDDLPDLTHVSPPSLQSETGSEGFGTAQEAYDKTTYSMAYVTPSHHFPLGMGMSLSRRVKLLEWALKTRTLVVEDESTSEFRYVGSPLTALKGLDTQDNVVYLGSFAKSLGVQVGFLVVPARLVAPLLRLKSLANSGASWLEQAAMAEFMDNGAYDRYLRKLRKQCITKRDLILTLLTKYFGPQTVDGMEGGLNLIWHLPKEFGSASSICKRMQENQSVGLYSVGTGGSFFNPQINADPKKYGQALIFGYSSLSLEEIEDGIGRLAKEIAHLKGAYA